MEEMEEKLVEQEGAQEQGDFLSEVYANFGPQHPGWPDGSCCCNCESWLPLHKHPWNEGEGKGAATETMGHVCLIQTGKESRATFFGKGLSHGFCEMHTPNAERRKFLWLEAKGKEYGI